MLITPEDRCGSDERADNVMLRAMFVCRAERYWLLRVGDDAKRYDMMTLLSPD